MKIRNKKFRGQRRYYRKLAEHNDFVKYPDFNIDKIDWFNFEHTHCDGLGYGNDNWKSRKLHLDALFRNYEYHPPELEKFSKPFQLFIYLNDFDSSQDALYIHSENPNEDNYPFRPELDDKPTLTNKNLIQYLHGKKEFTILYGLDDDGKGYCWLYRDGIGESLR